MKKLSFEQQEIKEVELPPKKLLYVKHPREFWYQEGKDKRCHQRILWLTRGLYLMEEWWEKNNISISYKMTSHTEYCLNGIKQLEKYIRELHARIAPHQQLDQYEFVLGMGATQILHAAVYAACIAHGKKSAKKNRVILTPLFFTHQLPGYLDTRNVIDMLSELNARWINYKKITQIDAENLVEVVTTPNNPDGRVLHPVTHAKYIIKDRTNYWPFFMTETNEKFMRDTLADEWVSVFSLSKLLSFSGSRVGYAFVKDPKIAHSMKHFIIHDTHGVASDGELHCLLGLKFLFEKNKLKEYFDWLSLQFKLRWERLQQAFSQTKMKLLNNQGANVWIKTPGNAEEYLLKKYHIVATYGPEYGVDESYARINVVCSTNEFEEFLKRLKDPHIIYQK